MALTPLLRRTTPLDRVVLVGLLVLVAVTFSLTAPRQKGSRVVVEQDGKIVYTAPLAEDNTVDIEGPLGKTTLTIRDGTACIASSPCPLKVCLGMGQVGEAGEILACVPNGVLARVEGESGREEGHDLITR